MREKSKNERIKGMHRWESRKRKWVREMRKVGGWLATRATPGREVLISGWVGYTLTNCLPARRRGSRAEGDLSPLKGLRFCRTPLPHSPFYTLSLSPTTPYLYFAPASRHALPFLFPAFSHASPYTRCLIEASTRLEDESFTSNKLLRKPTSS